LVKNSNELIFKNFLFPIIIKNKNQIREISEPINPLYPPSRLPIQKLTHLLFLSLSTCLSPARIRAKQTSFRVGSFLPWLLIVDFHFLQELDFLIFLFMQTKIGIPKWQHEELMTYLKKVQHHLEHKFALITSVYFPFYYIIWL
jgi:hypothetical protein